MNAATESNDGPSPPMRGRRLRRALNLRVRRTIPAHAGETCGTSREFGGSTDHPRARGGDCTSKRVTPYNCGIIADHPRACEGNAIEHRLTVLEVGPSPRTRGNTEREGGGHVTLGPSPRMRGRRLDHDQRLPNRGYQQSQRVQIFRRSPNCEFRKSTTERY